MKEHKSLTSNYHTLAAMDPHSDASDIEHRIHSRSAEAHFSNLHTSYGTSAKSAPMRPQTGPSFGSFGYGGHFGVPSVAQPLHFTHNKMRADVCPKCRCEAR